MYQVTDPDIVEHCKIWKAEKGVRTLVDLALDGNRMLTNAKESKMKKEKPNH